MYKIKPNNILSDNELANVNGTENMIVLYDNREYNILSHEMIEKLLFDMRVN